MSNLENFFNARIEALHGLRESVTDEKIMIAASIIAKENVIHVAAQHRSFPLAAYLYALCHLSVPNILLDSLGGMFAERGKTIRKVDVVLALSISP